jgi:hypothetical protein
MNKQVANFQLRTNEGVLTGNNNSCTWTNIDMSKILGDMWDNYEYFNLTLKCIAWNILPSDGTSNNSIQTQSNRYYMKGLDWENCNYDNISNSLKNSSCIGLARCYNSVSSTSGFIYYNPTKYAVNTFRKSTNIVDINIFIINNYTRLLGNLGTTGGRLFPNTIYDFTISPCKDYSETTALLTLVPSTLSLRGEANIFNNVNFKLLLGNLWGKFDKFSVELVDVQSSFFSNVVLDANLRACYLDLVGLQSINSNNNTCVLGNVYLDTAQGYTVSGFADEVDNSNSVKINEINNLVINFNSIETKKLITVTSGNIASHTFIILIRPIT